MRWPRQASDWRRGPGCYFPGHQEEVRLGKDFGNVPTKSCQDNVLLQTFLPDFRFDCLPLLPFSNKEKYCPTSRLQNLFGCTDKSQAVLLLGERRNIGDDRTVLGNLKLLAQTPRLFRLCKTSDVNAAVDGHAPVGIANTCGHHLSNTVRDTRDSADTGVVEF